MDSFDKASAFAHRGSKRRLCGCYFL